MGAAHQPYWRHFIATTPETDLSDKSVLDFGCNQGGFLRLLHALRPFRKGLGVDIARESIAAARSLKGSLPIDYEVATDLTPWADEIDVAFSYEVIYLLPDLPHHAEQIYQVLHDGRLLRGHRLSHRLPPMATLAQRARRDEQRPGTRLFSGRLC
jgi:SAM-dependent methyltransferase